MMAKLNGHEAGNGGYSQESPEHYRAGPRPDRWSGEAIVAEHRSASLRPVDAVVGQNSILPLDPTDGARRPDT